MKWQSRIERRLKPEDRRIRGARHADLPPLCYCRNRILRCREDTVIRDCQDLHGQQPVERSMQFANWSPRDVTVPRIRRARSRGREIFDARSRAGSRPFGADRGSILALANGAPTASDASEHPAGVAAIFMLGSSEPLPLAAAKSWPA